ncbi:RES family NAD+ phosphorylase [Nibrella saemangeumensis]|uniref:RES family NAD+ phosphorylase n=1 Tax=Nibrella saemangeumensis TaxID=1084526 RepID=A0ABP8MVN1_9BACT
MLVYRITRAMYAGSLVASGGAARWNSRGKFVIYTAATRALACLENVVHRSGEGLQDLFRVMVIEVPEQLHQEEISLDILPATWAEFQNYYQCQQIGDAWLQRMQTAVLRVPSAIVPNEYNYLLNPTHPDFARVRLIQTEPFLFDPRIKQ